MQGLKEHCEHTANYALERINTDEFKHTIRLACWLHDIGKLTDNFEKYLNSTVSGQDVKRGSVNHTFAGVIFILEKYHNVDNSKSLPQTGDNSSAIVVILALVVIVAGVFMFKKKK